MRQIGHLPTEAAAQTFGDFLFVEGIANEVEPTPGHGWVVWVKSEDQLDHARGLLAEFLRDPGAARFRDRARDAARLRAEEQQADLAYAKKTRTRRELAGPVGMVSGGPLTWALVAVSVGIFALKLIPAFYIQLDALLSISDARSGLPEVRTGQLWRLVTPIFLHSGILHVAFNLLWLVDLGGMIESRQSTKQLGLLVLVTAVLSNLAQYTHTGPNFGGMSGVVYGLLGYIWIRGRFDPGSGLFLHSQTVGMMLIWAFLCLTGLMGPIANTAHFAGLGVGMAWGYFSAARYR